MGWLISGLKSVIDGISDTITDGIAAVGNAISGGNFDKSIEAIHDQTEIEKVKNGTNSKFDNYGETQVIDWMDNGKNTRIPIEEMGIVDQTGTNEEYKVGETQTEAPSSSDNYQKYVDQVNAWRQEDFERQDTQFQRQVKDMQAAGINPNLALGALGGSATGGTSISAPPNTELEAELNEKLALMEQYIDNEFKADENQKDRLTDLIGGIVNIFLAKKLFK